MLPLMRCAQRRDHRAQLRDRSIDAEDHGFRTPSRIESYRRAIGAALIAGRAGDPSYQRRAERIAKHRPGGVAVLGRQLRRQSQYIENRARAVGISKPLPPRLGIDQSPLVYRPGAGVRPGQTLDVAVCQPIAKTSGVADVLEDVLPHDLARVRLESEMRERPIALRGRRYAGSSCGADREMPPWCCR